MISNIILLEPTSCSEFQAAMFMELNESYPDFNLLTFHWSCQGNQVVSYDPLSHSGCYEN